MGFVSWPLSLRHADCGHESGLRTRIKDAKASKSLLGVYSVREDRIVMQSEFQGPPFWAKIGTLEGCSIHLKLVWGLEVSKYIN